ncbi:hypothetical protein [Actinoplanes sp. NPDC020271]|uniref:hypothetical protein n=1 Tax=Actinoplanes sp. NPDC020271 TaxID=3363896 RepID=UPI00378FC431
MQDPHRRVVVAVDMESYSKRSNVLQHRAQVAFKQIMEKACAEAGLDRNSWRIQPGGDGELAILPPQVSERAIVGKLAPVVDRLLREHNQGLASEARIRLRLAVHQGLVHLDGANGFPSDAVVHVCRLNDSPQLKQALRTHWVANAALIVSDSLYRDVIVHYQDLRPDQFAKVVAEIPEKNFEATAWIHVPGETMGGGSSRANEPRPAPSASAPAAGQVFHGVTTHGPTQFGNHNTMGNPRG